MKSLLYPLAFLVALSGCSLFGLDGSSDQSTQLLVTLDEGETAALPPFNADLTFAALLEDSRCPIFQDPGGACFWEGQVSVRLRYNPASQPEADLTLTGFVPAEGDGAVTKDTLGLRFTLLRVAPYPVDGEDQSDETVRATLMVETL